MRQLLTGRGILASLAACLLLILFCLGCGGDGTTTPPPVTPTGVRIVSFTTMTVPVGGSTTMTVQYSATTAAEVGQTVRASAFFTRSGTDHEMAHQNVTLGAIDEVKVVQFQLSFPEGTPTGVYVVSATRAGVAGATIVPDKRNITLAPVSNVTLAFNPGEVNGVRGTFVSSLLTITPTAGFTGTITLTPRANELTLSQNTVVFTAENNDEPVQVVATYNIPAQALGDGTVAVVDYQIGDRPVQSTSFVVGYTIPQVTDFDIAVTPATVRVHGQQVMDTVRVTITPNNGWRGDVEVSLELPGMGSLEVDMPTNPVTVTVDGEITQEFHVRYVPGTGTAPIGTGIVRATSGGVGRDATFQVTAS